MPLRLDTWNTGCDLCLVQRWELWSGELVFIPKSDEELVVLHKISELPTFASALYAVNWVPDSKYEVMVGA